MEEEGCLGHHPSTAGSGTALRDRDAVEKSECVCMSECAWTKKKKRKQDWPCMMATDLWSLHSLPD